MKNHCESITILSVKRVHPASYAWPTEDIIIEGYPVKIGIWFYGAGARILIRAQMRDGKMQHSQLISVPAVPGANWTGWKYIEAEIPKGKVTPLKLDLAVRVMQTSDAKKNAGTVYVDNIGAVYGKTNDDLTNPTLKRYLPCGWPGNTCLPT